MPTPCVIEHGVPGPGRPRRQQDSGDSPAKSPDESSRVAVNFFFFFFWYEHITVRSHSQGTNSTT